MMLKVKLGDTWQELDMATTGDEQVSAIKARALAAQKTGAHSAPQYEVKFGGALVSDESVTLNTLGAGDGASLIVLARRRRPLR